MTHVDSLTSGVLQSLTSSTSQSLENTILVESAQLKETNEMFTYLTLTIYPYSTFLSLEWILDVHVVEIQEQI